MIPIVKDQELTYAQCAHPLEDFANWCKGTVVYFNDEPVAVTLPAGSTDAAIWPGDLLAYKDGAFHRIDQATTSQLVPDPIVELLREANTKTS